MLILSLPPVHQEGLLTSITKHPIVGAVRYNTGVESAYPPFLTVRRIQACAAPLGKPVYIDLKGKQLRVIEWGLVPYKPIILNHKISVELPAQIALRGDKDCQIREIVDGNKLYVDTAKPRLVGPGQSVNVLGKNLKVDGGLLDLDHEYIKAALSEGIRRFMLSFVESRDDVRELEEAIAVHSKGAVSVDECEIVFKIESQAGVDFVRTLQPKHFSEGSPYRLMAARDDLMIQIGALAMCEALRLIAEKDPKAICASRLLLGLEGGEVTMADISDVEYMRALGYKHFMLCDEISHEHANKALSFWQEYSTKNPF
ncbi:MAG: hypothetical protein HY457_00500 [Parcubacteria group bacterium]|nr:hypothetical protein [Parcubacteria group bacterium]